MSTVLRTVFISPVEPAPLSLRAPMGMETRLRVNFKKQDGAPYIIDTAPQVQLTGRTTNQTTTYTMPMVDLVNGTGQAVITPLDDPNGYRLRLLGTVDGQPALIATGVLATIASAGLEAMPEDVIDSIDLTLSRSVDATVIVKLWHDDGGTNPYDLSTVTLSAIVLDAPGGAPLASFAVTESGNQATMTMPMATVATLPDACWWTLTAAAAGGSQTLAQGNVAVTP